MRLIHVLRRVPAPWLCLALSVFVCCGEGQLPVAVGSSSEIVLVTDDAPLAALDDLVRALEKPVDYLGKDEPRFRVARIAASAFRAPYEPRNLILTGLLDGAGPVSRRMRRLLGTPRVERVRRNGDATFYITNAYAREQLVVVLAATQPSELQALLRGVAGELTEQLETAAVDRQRRFILANQSRVDAERIAARYGFEIAVPQSYVLAEGLDGWRDTLELVRTRPLRVVTVYWLDDVEALRARSRAFLLGMQRDAMWRLRGDTLLESQIHWSEADGAIGSALRLDGVWQNRDSVAGGPLRTRFVYDAGRRRLYAVQTLLFAPGRDKHPFVRELEALASTFRLRETR